VIVTKRRSDGRSQPAAPRLARPAKAPKFISGTPMRRFAALLAVLLVTACTNEIDTSVRPESVVGSYRLRAYAGQTPPTQISSDSLGTTELLSGELVISADKSWVESRVYRFVQGGTAQQYTFGSNGSWPS
jgi:hypothetical protein